ncbi:3-phosphoinositide-dependent protein kinase 1-like [Babylonia areolata]|uniref:3-phosphoinositide-dependent protein kinase 1-like n=1 Tax=Babylonia areolata TaxID=304850 RepID=UPI003FD369DA
MADSGTSSTAPVGAMADMTPSSPPAAAVAAAASVASDKTAQEGAAKKPPNKRTPNDFIFGKVIGEGSYSTVYLAKEVKTGTEFAIKVCDKKFIMREKKSEYIMREKTVLTKTNHPFIIKLSYTFQDPDRLYFVLQYARKGELLYYLNKLSSFDMKCSQFYAAEIVQALDYLQSQGVIHRDLKPENILLNEHMHIMITDFGSAKVLKMDGTDEDSSARPPSAQGHRRNSFVGTAQYVSPEVLNSKKAYFSSDLWALGCIIYQFLSGETPFRGGHEYQIFQKVCKLEYEIPEGFNPTAADLVKKLLVLEPSERLGCKELGGMDMLRQHEFFKGVTWEGLETQQAPELMPYLPATERNPEFWSNQSRTGFDDRRIAEIIISNEHQKEPAVKELPQDEHRKKLQEQEANNDYHGLVEGNLILKQGKVLKRKGLFARKRMLLLTEGPHLYYVDYSTNKKVLKGQIPWSQSLRPEAKNFKIFFVHTPNRTYYLESRDSDAHDWEVKINEVWQRYYGKSE